MEIYNLICKEPGKYYDKPDKIMPFLEELANSSTSFEGALITLEKLLKELKKQ
ncbi:hypothetical protein D3C86_2220170 [compost metagenome]